MITWVTVWVLTVTSLEYQRGYAYQLQYHSQATCEKHRTKHKTQFSSARCDFQQVPMVISKEFKK